MVSDIRCEIARKLNIDSTQAILAEHWKPYMTNLDSVVYDATCYESDIRYPTDIKLLWEATQWNYNIGQHMFEEMTRILRICLD